MADSDFDWLSEGMAPTAEQQPVMDVAAPAKKSTPVSSSENKNSRPASLIRAERKLSVPQRQYARFVEECYTIKQADEQMRLAGMKYNRATLYRWRQLSDFIEYQNELRSHMLAVTGISKEKVLLDAEKVKQLALEEQPVLYKGEPTGYTERQLGAALRALELQGKGVGIGDEENRKVVVSLDIDFSGRAGGVTVEGELADEGSG